MADDLPKLSIKERMVMFNKGAVDKPSSTPSEKKASSALKSPEVKSSTTASPSSKMRVEVKHHEVSCFKVVYHLKLSIEIIFEVDGPIL